MSLAGSAGLNFNVTETSQTSTGSITQVQSVPSTLSSLSIDPDGIVASITGSVGTTAFDLDLTNLVNASGTGYSVSVVRNQAVDFTSYSMIIINNTHISNTLIIGKSASNSLFTWGGTNPTLSIPGGTNGGAFVMTVPSTSAIGSNGKINIVGSSASTTFNIWILGA